MQSLRFPGNLPVAHFDLLTQNAQNYIRTHRTAARLASTVNKPLRLPTTGVQRLSGNGV